MSFLPSPYGPISCSQLGSRHRPRPINAPRSAQLGGGEVRGGPSRRPLFLRVPPQDTLLPETCWDAKVQGGVRSLQGGHLAWGVAARGGSASELAAA